MNKSELIGAISEKANLATSKSGEVMDLFFESIASTLTGGGRVEIRGFGAFSVKAYPGYLGRNPKTAEQIVVRQKRLPVWRTGLDLKKRVNSTPSGRSVG